MSIILTFTIIYRPFTSLSPTPRPMKNLQHQLGQHVSIIILLNGPLCNDELLKWQDTAPAISVFSNWIRSWSILFTAWICKGYAICIVSFDMMIFAFSLRINHISVLLCYMVPLTFVWFSVLVWARCVLFSCNIQSYSWK